MVDAAGVDFSGTWTRDASRGVNNVEYIKAHGFTREEALAAARAPYVQQFERSEDNELEWKITTYEKDGTTPRRTLLYRMGEWEEEHSGNTGREKDGATEGWSIRTQGGVVHPSLFSNKAGAVTRDTTWVLEAGAAASEGEQEVGLVWTHKTETSTPRGVETITRALVSPTEMVIRRSLDTSQCTYWNGIRVTKGELDFENGLDIDKLFPTTVEKIKSEIGVKVEWMRIDPDQETDEEGKVKDWLRRAWEGADHGVVISSEERFDRS